jgi:hypothetical protein
MDSDERQQLVSPQPFVYPILCLSTGSSRISTLHINLATSLLTGVGSTIRSSSSIGYHSGNNELVQLLSARQLHCHLQRGPSG